MNRIADVLFEPLWGALLLLALVYALRERAPRLAAALPALTMGWLLFFSLPVVANALVRRLEVPVLSSAPLAESYDAVIVLGGGMNLEASEETGRFEYGDPVERLLAGYDLLRTGRARNAILSGGTEGGTRAEALLMAGQLEAWGIDASRLAIEDRSLTTHENAVFSVQIARQRGWTHDLLVTSAAHMARARGCFAAEGLTVDTLAVDFQSSDPGRHPPGLLPRARALALSTAAIREAVGRLVYGIRGWTR